MSSLYCLLTAMTRFDSQFHVPQLHEFGKTVEKYLVIVFAHTFSKPKGNRLPEFALIRELLWSC